MVRAFVTGGSGFLGRVVVAGLQAAGLDVRVLTRRQSSEPGTVVGDLTNPSAWAAALRDVDVVVHLAATTGKAPANEYVRVNIEGTRAMIDAASAAGVPRFLFCSSIAVTFGDLRHYPYAESKRAGELLVQSSALRTTIVRPTIIAGPGSPVLTKLAALAGLPVVPLFGGGHVLVQPILVDDLARFIVDLVLSERPNETLELGGRDVLSMKELLDHLRRAQGKSSARFLPIPLGLVLPPLGWVEAVAGPLLPLTVGQLATFRFDGRARPNALWNARQASLASLDRLLAVGPSP
jgi:nucleoside-diphosphate-sugar epimerase